MSRKLKKIEYKISDRISDYKVVTGWAVESSVPVRFCVRKLSRNFYRIDHFDTGSWIDIPLDNATSKESAIFAAEALLIEKLLSGEYAEAVRKWKNGEIQ